MDSIIGYAAAAVMGVLLGLVGGGGSILTVPVLVYLFHIEPTLATAYSLFIVGTTALAGGIQSALKKDVDFPTAVMFAVPGFVGVYATRRYLVPLMPDELLTIGSWSVSRDTTIMVFFGILMLLAGVSMLREQKVTVGNSRFKYPIILLEGLIVGAVTGIVGAGGGFLIIPALVVFAGLPMNKAIGTSLVIISAKSLIGFVGDINAGQPIDPVFVGIVSAIAIVGIYFGRRLAEYVGNKQLKTVFAWFVLVMAVGIIALELIP